MRPGGGQLTRVAAVDCGTNSIRLLIADVNRDELVDVHRELRIVRLGQGVDGSGRLAPEAIARTEAALRELYAFYRRTEPMYTSLLRDEPVVPIIQQLLRGFHDYVRAIEGTLMAGRGLRGGGARRTRAAIGHAVAFPTWRSLTHDQGLSDADAMRMMCLLVRGAA